MESEASVYELVVDFDQGRGDPSRIFKAMGGIVDALQSLDKHLIAMIDEGLGASLVLDSVEAGSVRATLRNVISDIPDEALAKSDWRLIVGHFLLKAKYLILRWCEDRDTLVSRSNVEELTQIIANEATNTGVKVLPAYGPLQPDALLSDVQAIQQSLAVLDENDRATYVSSYGRVHMNPRLVLSAELVREILTRHVVKTHQITLMRVKKPDYLGRSQWSFQYSGHRIDASILDKEWLGRFQARLVDVRPGDSLKVDLTHEIFYGYLDEIIHQQYTVNHVIDVVRPELWTQSDAFDDDDS